MEDKENAINPVESSAAKLVSRPENRFDISELFSDKTINLDSSLQGRDTDVSFRSNGITMHSTQYPVTVDEITVDEILATSFVDNVREMRNSLHANSGEISSMFQNSSRYLNEFKAFNFGSNLLDLSANTLQANGVNNEKLNSTAQKNPFNESMPKLLDGSLGKFLRNRTENITYIITKEIQDKEQQSRKCFKSRVLTPLVDNNVVEGTSTKTLRSSGRVRKSNTNNSKLSLSTIDEVLDNFPVGNNHSDSEIVNMFIPKASKKWVSKTGTAAPNKANTFTVTSSSSHCSNNKELSSSNSQEIPIKATASQLSWASVKLRTDAHKSVQIKNTSNQSLLVHIEIFGLGFQLINPESNRITLQSQECRTIVVNFYATTIGPADGKIVFRLPRNQNGQNCASNTTLSSEIVIKLYAYGGNAIITIRQLLKGPVGSPFLTMGELPTRIRPLKCSFTIFNKGSIMGFAAIYTEPIGLQVPEISNSFYVYPDCALIKPNAEVTIHIVFQPNLNDLRNIRKIISDVLTIAKLRILYGDEANRQRLRQIKNFMSPKIRSLEKLWTEFPAEQRMFEPGFFKDNASLAQDIWTCISEQEVALTLNKNMFNDTEAEMSIQAENTILFRTVTDI